MIRELPLTPADLPLADRCDGIPTAIEIGSQGIQDISEMMLSIGGIYSKIYGFRDEDFSDGPLNEWLGEME